MTNEQNDILTSYSDRTADTGEINTYIAEHEQPTHSNVTTLANKPKIKQSVLNSFQRVGIQSEVDQLLTLPDNATDTATNRFSGDTVTTTPLVAFLIYWVYATSNAYERGDFTVNVSDFDRIRYFVLAQDSKAYMACLD